MLMHQTKETKTLSFFRMFSEQSVGLGLLGFPYQKKNISEKWDITNSADFLFFPHSVSSNSSENFNKTIRTKGQFIYKKTQ